MKQITWLTGISVLTAVLSSGAAQAATFTEIGDAGDTLTTAQIIPIDLLPLDAINGTLSDGPDADLFKIFLSGGQTFSATTVGGSDVDTQLFLFDADGLGIYFNDDSSGMQSTLPTNSPFTPTKSGFYYLAISGFNFDPVNALGSIFPNLSDFPVDVPLDSLLEGVFGPTGTGGVAPLSEFDGANLSDGGSYTIALTGVRPAESVPEPASAIGLLAFGVWGAAQGLKNKHISLASRKS